MDDVNTGLVAEESFLQDALRASQYFVPIEQSLTTGIIQREDRLVRPSKELEHVRTMQIIWVKERLVRPSKELEHAESKQTEILEQFE